MEQAQNMGILSQSLSQIVIDASQTTSATKPPTTTNTTKQDDEKKARRKKRHKSMKQTGHRRKYSKSLNHQLSTKSLAKINRCKTKERKKNLKKLKTKRLHGKEKRNFEKLANKLDNLVMNDWIHDFVFTISFANSSEAIL